MLEKELKLKGLDGKEYISPEIPILSSEQKNLLIAEAGLKLDPVNKSVIPEPEEVGASGGQRKGTDRID